MSKQPAIELKGITKTFGKVVANKNVNLTAYRGEILSILGENGSGKTTLMNMISGIYFPDEGQIFIDGKEALIASPKDAFDYKIGMIHQHFKLVDVFSAAENIVLGIEDKKYNLSASTEEIKKISSQYGFELVPEKKIYTMSVSEKQTVEIIKVLYRGADILILDHDTVLVAKHIHNSEEAQRRRHPVFDVGIHRATMHKWLYQFYIHLSLRFCGPIFLLRRRCGHPPRDLSLMGGWSPSYPP